MMTNSKKTILLVSLLAIILAIFFFLPSKTSNSKTSIKEPVVPLERPKASRVTVAVQSDAPIKLQRPCSRTYITIYVTGASASNYGIYSKDLQTFNPQDSTNIKSYTIQPDDRLPSGSTVDYSTAGQVDYMIPQIIFGTNPPDSNYSETDITYSDPNDPNYTSDDDDEGFQYTNPNNCTL